jgi:AGZA family xanthine/uracil permease-like MFS transporter
LSATIDPPLIRPRYAWARRGDVNAFFGLMLDNIGDMILMTYLLVVKFEFPKDFVLTRMIPGTAVGVLVGDLIFTLMAFRLARKSRRTDVTAMPLGLDTPSTFGAVFLILGPAFLAAKGRGLSPDQAAKEAWFVGISMILASGIFKLACSFFSGLIRRMIPRAGLLGSLTAIALVLISFLPLLDIASTPVAGMTALSVILVTLTARWKLPKNIPGALAALVIGCIIYYGMNLAGLGPGLGGGEGGRPSLVFRAILPMPIAEWFEWFQATWRVSVTYLPVAIPLALGTIVGGIDCTESAASAGDNYPTGQIIAAEGFATIVGGIFGGVIQSTPYIGHPAYKAMGAGAAYTLATALFIGVAGVFGFFDWIFYLLPKSAVFPILIFVGLEITAQSFQATPTKHYPAVALACVPALAYLAAFAVNRLIGEGEVKPFDQLSTGSQHFLQTIMVLSGGFIITSLLWGSVLTFMIDGQIKPAVASLILAGACALFGIIHSPLPNSPIIFPNQAIADLKRLGRYEAAQLQTPYHWAAAYWLSAGLLIGLGKWGRGPSNSSEVVLPER